MGKKQKKNIKILLTWKFPFRVYLILILISKLMKFGVFELPGIPVGPYHETAKRLFMLTFCQFEFTKMVHFAGEESHDDE